MKGLLFTYGMTYGGAIIALFNPFAGLLIYICFAIIRPDSMWFWAVPPGNYSRIIAVALVIGWAIHGFGNWRLGRAKPIVVALVGFWLWSAVSAVQAPDHALAWGFVEDITKIVLPFLVGVSLIDSVARLKQLAWVILLSQGYVAYELNLSYFQGYNRLVEEGFGAMDNNCNAIALVTCTGLAFFLSLNSEAWWQKAVAFGAALLMMHAIFFSFSRGAMVTLVLVGLVTFVLIPKQPGHYLAFVLTALLALRMAGPQVVDRFTTVFADAEHRDTSAGSRLELWAACWDTMQQTPLGVGPGQWGLVVEQYGFPRGKQAHTLWLQIGAELGFPGMFVLMFFYLICLVRLWPYAWGSAPVTDRWFRHLACMVIAAMAGFTVSAQFVSLYGLEVPYYVTLLGAGVLKLTSTAAGVTECASPSAGDALTLARTEFRFAGEPVPSL